MPQLMYPESSTVRRSGRSNKGITSMYRDYNMSRLGTSEYRYDSPAQVEHSMPGIQPLYTHYHALVGFNNQYAQGITHQPNPVKFTPVPQHACYQPYTGYSHMYPSYQPLTGSSNNVVQQFTNQPATDVSNIAGNTVFVITGDSWIKYDVENLGSPSRST